MEIEKMNKSGLLDKCKELGITRCSSKNKSELIDLINDKMKTSSTTLDVNVNVNANANENYVLPSTTQVTKQIKHLKPLIKWSGGKSDEIKQFEKYIQSFGSKFLFYSTILRSFYFPNHCNLLFCIYQMEC